MTINRLKLIYPTKGDQTAGFNSPTIPRTSISETDGQWRASVAKRLEQLIRLDLGWDGYQGRPLSFTNAAFAYQMLESMCGPHTPAPQIVPGADGDLQIEWHTPIGDIELDVRGPNDVHAWRSFLDQDPEGEELSLRNDFSTIATWVMELTEPVIAPIAATA